MTRLVRSILLSAFSVLALAGAPFPETTRAAPPEACASVAERNAQSAGRARTERARRQRARRARRARYRRLVRSWHRRASRDDVRAWRAQDPRPLVLRPVGRGEQYELLPDAEGRFGAADLARVEEALRHRDGRSHAIHPRLVELVYRAAREFAAPYVTVVSGYRPDRSSSRHTQGRAIDIVLPGISDRRLSRYLFRQGFVGVGIYTGSGFVHLDVRARSYFWIDRSAPGQPQRLRRILPARAARNDADARARGEEVVADLENTGETPEDAPSAEDVVAEPGG
jgi:uncharacterized protein YcbK (DUF882 family)